MTETSYTAWDDKLYQWPPPDGWYEAGDGKWWPEGYGPGPVGAEPIAETDDHGATAGGDGGSQGHLDAGSFDSGLGAAGGLGAAAGTGFSSASDALGGLADGAESAADAATDALPDSLSDRGADALSSGRSALEDRLEAGAGSAADAVSGAGSDLADGLPESFPDAVSGSMPDSLSGVGSGVADSLTGGGSFADSLPDSLPDSVGDAIPDSLRDSVASPGDSTPGSLLGDAADRLGGGSSGLDGDRPANDDVGAALAETMSARTDDLSDPASSGISGLAALAGDNAGDNVGDVADDDSTRAADAAASASEFFTADIPASDLGSLGDRPPTDLDALPPPSFDPPGASDPLSSPAASASSGLDGLADLAEPAAGFPAPETDIDPIGGAGSDSLFGAPGSAPSPDPSSMPAPIGFDSPGSGPSIGGFDLPPGETLPPTTRVPPATEVGPSSGAGEIGGAAAAALGLPMTGEPGPGIGQPDETIVAPLSQPGGSGQNPAETGQFQPAADAQSWDAPAGQYGAPPPQAEGPGSMPWGQAGTPGGPPVAGGLDQAVLQDNRSGSSKTLLLVGLGVAALVVLGIVAFTLFRGSDDDSGGDITGPGSLAEPHARTTPVEIFYPTGDAEQRFVVEVLEPVRDASAQAEGTPPADGQRFAVTTVRVANQSAADATVSDLRFNAVTASGEVLERESNGCAITEPALDFAAVLGQAGVAEGVVCWVVPAENYDGLMLGIESTQVSGRIHIDLQ